jgi:hypothetical protein
MTSVNPVSRRPAKANYKPLTWGNVVSEDRHNPIAPYRAINYSAEVSLSEDGVDGCSSSN